VNLSREQFEQLALAQLDTLYRVARRLTRDPQSAEDLVQDTMVRAIRSWDSFRLESYGIRPWLMRIMHNLHLNRVERAAREPVAMQDDRLESADPPRQQAGPWPWNDKNFEYMDERLVRAIEALPPEYSAVLMLWAVEDFAYKEIAEALDIPIGTVMSRLHRARQRLANELKDLAREEGRTRE